MTTKIDTPQRGKVGARIRSLRLERGLSQAEVAQRAGISASYLNLIEHDRRRIAGPRLAELAALLGTTPARLSDGVAAPVVAALSAMPVSEGEAAETFAERFPGWAGHVVAQARRIADFEARQAAQETRMARDPAVAAALHQIITSASAIQSAAAILVGGGLDADWQGRFQRNVHDDSQRLSAASAALLQYLDTLGGEAPRSPVAEVSEWMQREGLGEAVADIDRAVEAADLSAPGRAGLRDWLSICAQDAALLPEARVQAAFAAHPQDPAAMATALGAPLPAVLRRLAALSGTQGLPEMGLAICDAAGALRVIRKVAGFDMPEAGGCPLMPLFEALSTPGRPVRAAIAMPGGRTLTAYAIATLVTPTLEAPPRIEAVMLVVADADAVSGPRADPPEMPAAPIRPVGVTCTRCPRRNCAARRAPEHKVPGIELIA